jgi:hypothetical protein
MCEYICIQHLVRLRWEELNPEEHKNFAKLSIDLMYEIADPCEDWALKSQVAALVTDIHFYLHCLFFCHNCNFALYKTIIGLWYFDR